MGGDLCQTKDRMFSKHLREWSMMDLPLWTETLSEMTFCLKLYGDFSVPQGRNGARAELLLPLRDALEIGRSTRTNRTSRRTSNSTSSTRTRTSRTSPRTRTRNSTSRSRTFWRSRTSTTSSSRTFWRSRTRNTRKCSAHASSAAKLHTLWRGGNKGLDIVSGSANLG